MSTDRIDLLTGGGIAGCRLGVLLVHGLGGTPVELSPLARRLRRDGARVLCCRLAGHCGTADELGATRWHDWYASVEAALDRLAAEADIVVAGGLSMGALLAARLAREQPRRVAGLVMLAPTLRYDGWSIPRYSFLLRLLIHTPFGRRYRFVEQQPYGVKDARIRARVQHAMFSGNSGDAGLAATPALAIREMWRLVAEVRPRLGEIRQPSLVIHAREDDVAGLSNVFHLQRQLGGRVEALVLEDSYHLITIDRQRDLVGQRVASFLTGLAAAPSAAQPHPMPAVGHG